jgi:predicted lipoprotein with Yx(FWY)xxD motif
MNRITVLAISVVATLAMAGAAMASSAHTSAATTIIKTRSSQYGTILVNGSGQTIYLDNGDKPPKFACTSGCQSAWPPVKAVGKLKAEGGAKQSMLGSVKDGNFKIVTYAGHPLYLFASDSGKAITGEGSNGFYVVSASSGKAVKSTTTTTTTSTSSSNLGY